MRKAIIVSVILIVIILVGVGIYFNSLQQEVLGGEIGGIVVETNIQTPHPYQNSNSGRQIVWSYDLDLSNTNATSLRLYFDDFDVNGRFTNTSYTVEYPPCPAQSSTVELDENGSVVSVSGSRKELCGNVSLYFSPQEVYDNNYIEGDFILIKDGKSGKILDILTGNSDIKGTRIISEYNTLEGWPVYSKEDEEWLREALKRYDDKRGVYRVGNWWYYYDTNRIIIELYADEFGNSYGLSVNKYTREWI